MTTLMIVFVLIALVALAAAKMRQQSGETAEELTYYAKTPLTLVEQQLYYRLVKALPSHRILSQVSLYQLVGIKKGAGQQAAMNRINRKCADFVVCSPAFKVAAVIELDDSSHDTERGKKADGEKDDALKAAGIRVIRWRIKAIPSVEEITKIFAADESHAESTPVPR